MAESDPVLTRPPKYNVEDSNIALLGSDLEKQVREHVGDKEPAWEAAGTQPGTQIWRIEKFSVVEWPKERYGSFYDGDSYIVLHTYKKSKDSEDLSYDLHFWIGAESTQDEAATAAYKTVELDDHLRGLPVQYREIQGHESPRFLSLFPKTLFFLKGGVATGFHRVSAPPPDDTRRFYRVIATGTRLLVREVPVEGSSLVPGDVYVLDLGEKVLQLNTKGSVGKERFKAAEFVQSLINDRRVTGHCEVQVFEEGGSGTIAFLRELGLEAVPSTTVAVKAATPPSLYRLSDSCGQVTFDPVEPANPSSLSSADTFLLDASSHRTAPAIYIWIGKDASLTERRLALQYAQAFLYRNQEAKGKYSASIVKMREGHESDAFLKAFETEE